MKSFSCLFVLFSILGFNVCGQSFYNGSFEINTFTTCVQAVTDVQFSSKMQRVVAFGKTWTGGNQFTGKTSVQDSGCSVIPQEGSWCVGLHSNFGTTSDAIALELTDSLVPGTLYYLSFYLYGNKGFQNYQSNVKIGESLISYDVGTTIYTATPDYLVWKNIYFSFTASKRSKYITVKIVPSYNSWVQVDNFLIAPSALLGVDEHNTSNFFSLYPNPVNTELTIHFANDPEPYLVECYSQLGQLALPKRIIHAPSATLDLAALPEGIYTLRVTNSRSTVFKKIIVAR